MPRAASAVTVPHSDFTNIDLVKKHALAAWATVPRQSIVNNIATAESLTERVYWALILYSWCGKHTREACFLKDDAGYLVLDENGQPVPLRQKHLLQILSLKESDRGNISHSFSKLVQDKRLEKRDGLWCPVVESKNVAVTATLDDESCCNNSEVAYTFPTQILGIKIPAELFEGRDNVAVTATLQHLEKIKEDAVTAFKLLMQQHRNVLQQYISENRIISSEKLDYSYGEDEEQKSSSSFVDIPATEQSTTTNAPTSVLQEELPALIAHYGKGALTKKQFSGVVELVAALPNPHTAVRIFLDEHLPERLPRLKHVGGIPSVAIEFAETWQEQLRRETTAAALVVPRAGPTLEALEEANKILNDPDATEHERQIARELLGHG